MAKIDIEKFVASLMKVSKEWIEQDPDTFWYLNGLITLVEIALEHQGLQCSELTGEIVPIEPAEPFRIESGKWYVCIKPVCYNGIEFFTQGKIYLSSSDNHLISNQSQETMGAWSYWIPSKMEDFFRLATEEEIKQQSVQIGEAVDTEELNKKINPSQEPKTDGLQPSYARETMLVEAVTNEPVEQKPKFKVGDYVKNVNDKREPIYEIVYMDKECYICEYRGKENIGDKAVMHFAFDCPYLRHTQKPAWSEEDEEMLKTAITSCEQCGNEYAYYWLKSIKNRVAPQQAMWSEEDKMRLNHLIRFVEKHGLEYYASTDIVLDWLKSLKDRIRKCK